MANRSSYACGGYRDGDVCKNDIFVRRDEVENAILGPIRRELLAPERVARMVEQMQAMFVEQVRARVGQAERRPQQLADLDARIERMRERQRSGDPDLTADELEGAIARALEKRKELEAALPGARQTAAVLAALPRAAELYRQQIALGLDGDPRAALKARVILGDLFNGKIVLRPGPDRSLWAEFEIQPATLIRVGTGGGRKGTA